MDRDKLKDFLIKVWFTDDENSASILATAIANTFGKPEIKYPEIDDGTMQMTRPEQIWKVCLDAVKRLNVEGK